MSRIFQHFEQPQMTTFTQQGAAFGGGGRSRGSKRKSASSPSIYRNVDTDCILGSAGAVVASAGAFLAPNPLTISGAAIAWGNAVEQCTKNN